MNTKSQAIVVIGLAQIIASAGGHYLPAVIASPVSESLGLPAVTLFACFSGALVIAALLGPSAGRFVDRLGGRPVLLFSNLFFAAGLACLALADGWLGVILAYVFIGVGLATGLFEVAFAALVKLFGKDSRNAITGITLLSGMASFVGWTTSVYVEAKFGWRGVCWFWATAHVVLGLPLHALIPRLPQAGAATTAPEQAQATSTTGSSLISPKLKETDQTRQPDKAWVWRTSLLLAYVFAANSFVGMGLMMHMPQLLQDFGVGLALAFTIGSLVGPSQIIGRLLEFFFMRRWHPLYSTRLAALCHPIASLTLLMAGAPLAAFFVIVHGIGNGILIIARGTLPLAIFGASGYGHRQGWLMMPAKFAQAAAPFVFGLVVTEWAANTLWLTCAMGVSVLIALLFVTRASRA